MATTERSLMLNLAKFEGRLPYSKELYGVYQPLIGWKSRLIRNRIKLQNTPLPVVGSFGPDEGFDINVDNVVMVRDMADLFRKDVLAPRFDVPEYLDSIIIRYLQLELFKHLKDHAPEDNLFWSFFWREQFSQKSLNKILHNASEGISRIPLHRIEDFPVELRPIVAYINQIEMMFATREEALQYLYSREVYTARYLHSLLPKDPADEVAINFPQNVNKLLLKTIQPPDLKKILEMYDIFNLANANNRDAVLSPIGFIHLFQQYFFEFDNFLGQPVEHIWLSPGSTTELIDVSTRRELQEFSLEQLFESITKTESGTIKEDELSKAMKNENQKDTKMGASLSGGASILIAHVEASGSMSIEETQKQAREQTHRSMRQQSAKTSSEIRSNYKSTFRTVTETTDLHSKRYVITNPGSTLVNYELRRKMRQVGVQVQDMGTQLCWQTYIDDAGAALGISQLVHLASKADMSPYTHLPLKTKPQSKTEVVTILLPVPNPGQRSELGPIIAAGFLGAAATGAAIPGAVIGVAVYEVLDSLFGDDDDKGDDYTLEAVNTIHQPFKINMPEGYELAPNAQQTEEEPFSKQGPLGDIPIRWFKKNGDGIKFHMTILSATEGTMDLVVNSGNVTPGELIEFQAKVTIVPTAEKTKAVTDENAGIILENNKRDTEKERKIKEDLIKSVKERVEFASKITSRKSEDLREEERTVIYRKLVEKLMREAWSVSFDRKMAHLRSELVKSLFDVDKMLYFVAPEWWQPRLHQSSLATGADEPDYNPVLTSMNVTSKAALAKTKISTGIFNKKAAQAKLGSLGTEDLVGWGGEGRPDNYLVTENSAKAKLGSSLGWLLQLDGDNLRNAFLNAPWVKAVIPIRPGKEKEAMEWLKQSQVEGTDGLNEVYAGDDQPGFKDKFFQKFGIDKDPTIDEVLLLLTDDLKFKQDEATRIISEDLEIEPGQTKTLFYLRPDEVFEKGFDPLLGGFKAQVADDPEEKHYRIFTQWVEVLPTDQIVAVEVKYDPKTGMQI